MSQDIYTLDEAADYLGIAPSTLRKYAYGGRIAYCSPHGRMFFAASDLTAYVLRFRKTTAGPGRPTAGQRPGKGLRAG